MAKLNDQRKLDNQRKCGANRLLVFMGAVAKDEVDSMTGKDVVHLILLFSDGISFRLFDPRQAVNKKSGMAVTLGSLCEALGVDWGDVPGCFGWEDLCSTLVTFFAPHTSKSVYAKITLNAGGWPTYGTGRCFSAEPDMIYSKDDLIYLETGEGDLAHPTPARNIVSPPTYDDLPF